MPCHAKTAVLFQQSKAEYLDSHPHVGYLDLRATFNYFKFTNTVPMNATLDLLCWHTYFIIVILEAPNFGCFALFAMTEIIFHSPNRLLEFNTRYSFMGFVSLDDHPFLTAL